MYEYTTFLNCPFVFDSAKDGLLSPPPSPRGRLSGPLDVFCMHWIFIFLLTWGPSFALAVFQGRAMLQLVVQDYVKKNHLLYMEYKVTARDAK